MSDMFLGSQAPLYQNVRICRRNKNGKILEERYAKNRVTRLMLYGIGKFLLGHFNNSSPDKIYEFIPRYLALGTNTPGSDVNYAGVGTTSSVEDTRLLNEITKSNIAGASETVNRIWIAERNMCKLNTKFSDPFIKVSIKTYVSSSQYDGVSIGEAGLFSKEKDNNCLARVCFSPITKNSGEVLDIQWDITLLSYGETKYPEKLEIENGSTLSIPLKYTNKKFVEYDLGLKKYWTGTIGRDGHEGMFNINFSTGQISVNDEYLSSIINNDDEFDKSLTHMEKVKQYSGWYEYLTTLGLEDKFETFYNLLIDSKLNDASNDGKNARFLYSQNHHIPTIFYFGNLYVTQDTIAFDNDSLCATLSYTEDKHTVSNDVVKNVSYAETNISGDYIINTPNNNITEYKVSKNRFYKKGIHDSVWIETSYFMYSGTIVNANQEESGYIYKNGNFYSVKTNIIDTFTNQFLNFSGTVDEKFYIYDIDSQNKIQKTNYAIDTKDNAKIYLDGEYTTYHLSNDKYWVTGDYVKLTPIITPSNSTDKSVSWKIQNKDVATINWDGVVTGWNLGETVAIASTSNDLLARCTIDVIKDTSYVDIENITINPQSVTLNTSADTNHYVIVAANVEPLFATNSTLNWNLSSEISDSVSIVNLGNNQVKVMLNNTSLASVGYLTATSQNGKIAKCVIQVI